MSKRSETNLQGIPMKPYDLLREGIVMFTLCAVVILLLAILLGSPDYPAVRAEDVARRQPLAYLKTCANILAGNSDLSGYGPPYTRDRSKAQRFLGIAPANWFGVAIPLDPPRDFILKPLARAAILDETMAPALKTFEAAKPAQRQAWLNAYLAGLNKATIVRGQAQLPSGNYGPVPVLMNGMLALGRSGLLEGALESNARLPYTLNLTRSLLFFQDDVYHGVAQNLDMLGKQWGISHETGPYPGAWWLWPYTFLYQIPPMSESSNGDLLVGILMGLIFLVMLLLPYIPILNRLPRWLRIYRIIWRDWYRR